MAAFTEAREGSLAFRERMNLVADRIRHEVQSDHPLPFELLQPISQLKRDYHSFREIFFKQVFLNASGIVEEVEDDNLYSVLFRTSQSLFAGMELVKNFHSAAAMINLHPSIREFWNQPDPTVGLARDSWNQSLENSQRSIFRDFFRAGLVRLRDYQVEVEDYWFNKDCNFLALYSQGVEGGIEEIQENFDLFELGFVEMYSEEDEHELIEVVEESKQARTFWSQRGPLLGHTIDQDGGLIRGHVRLEVYQMVEKYLSLRQSLYYLALKHLPQLTREDIPYQQQDRLRGIGISLLSALTLYGNAQELNSAILRIPELKDLLNQGDPDRGIPENFRDEALQEFHKIKHRQLFEEGLWKFDELYHQQEPALGQQKDHFLAYVRAELGENPIVSEIRGETYFDQIVWRFQFQAKRGWGFLGQILGGAKYVSTKMFVNIMSMFELRPGKLSRDPRWEEFVRARLQPGDILLERSPFRLTERLVPGYFAHAAIYVGSYEELHKLNLSSDQHVRNHLSEIKEDKIIAEALREGTKLATLKSFLDVDDLAILRPKPRMIPQEEVREAVSLAFSHVGKKYDFNFDTNSWDAVTCSEMVFHSYLRVPWSFGKVLDSFSIAPDDIAIFAGSEDSRPFSLITFIHDGQLVHDQKTGLDDEALFIELLRGRYTEGFPRSPSEEVLGAGQ